MIRRHLTSRLRQAVRQYPVVTVTGPRQSGKTTLVRRTFPRFHYVSLESPDDREFALVDPKGFLARFDRPVILDEVQRAPELFSYIQTLVDDDDRPGRFVLTGSQNFLLLQSVTQSLAGRVAILHLLPPSWRELTERRPDPIGALAGRSPRRVNRSPRPLSEVLHAGFYPRIHDKGLAPRQWLSNYYQTYLERDVRQLVGVGDLDAFSRFVRLCAGRHGQLLNLAGLAADAGITHTTAGRWLSVLQASFIVTLLRPYHRNFSKRLIKAPKLYFVDAGLASYLLDIRSPSDLEHHAMRGALVEGFVVLEVVKRFLNDGEMPTIWFWRDSAGHEVDLVVEHEGGPSLIEVKSGLTVAADAFDGIEYWRRLAGDDGVKAVLVYGGSEAYVRHGVSVRPWFTM